MFRITIEDSLLVKSSKGYPCIKIKCRKENGRVIYSDHFFSKKSKILTKIELLDMLEDFGIKVNRKYFVTPRYLNKMIKQLINKEAACNSTRLYNNIYKRELLNIDKIPEEELHLKPNILGFDFL